MRKCIELMLARDESEIPYPAEKKCKKCGLVKTASEFAKNKRLKCGLNTYCRPCQKTFSLEYVAANPEKAKASRQKWVKENREYVNQRAMGYYNARDVDVRTQRQRDNRRKHRDKRNAAQRKNYQENREAKILEAAVWRLKLDPVKSAAYQREYSRKNPEIRSAAKNARRARKNGATGSHTAEEWVGLKEYFGNCCAYCLKNASECGALTRDHMMPLSGGGSDSIENIVPSCRKCNSSKQTKNIIDFSRYQFEMQELRRRTPTQRITNRLNGGFFMPVF